MHTRPLIPKNTWTSPVVPPELTIHPPKIQALIRRLRTPQQVQRWIYSLKYNTVETLCTLDGVAQKRRAHCLEAAQAAATVLEYHGFPPLILDLESTDLLDHTLFLYRHKGRYGTVGMSRDVGLYGRKPVYRTIRSLALSYAAPYIDARASIKRYGVLDLRNLRGGNWRDSKKNVWYVEQALRDVPHRRLGLSHDFVRTWRRRYLVFKKQYPNRQPDFYPGQQYWA